MPKSLFYAGVTSVLLIAFASLATARALLAQGISALGLNPPFLIPEAGRSASSTVLLFLLVFSAAALFVRMASLLAARNLFASFLALFSVSCTALAFLAASLVRIPSGAAQSPNGAGQVSLLLGGLLSLTFVVLTPYFKVQANWLLRALAFVPLPLFVWGVSDALSGNGGLAIRPDSAALFLYLIVLGALFFSVAIHSMRHRHLFVEITNLRELLDSPSDPGSTPPATHPVGFGGDVAFHH